MPALPVCKAPVSDHQLRQVKANHMLTLQIDDDDVWLLLLQCRIRALSLAPGIRLKLNPPQLHFLSQPTTLCPAHDLTLRPSHPSELRIKRGRSFAFSEGLVSATVWRKIDNFALKRNHHEALQDR